MSSRVIRNIITAPSSCLLKNKLPSVLSPLLRNINNHKLSYTGEGRRLFSSSTTPPSDVSTASIFPEQHTSPGITGTTNTTITTDHTKTAIDTEASAVSSEEELQESWKAMERRVSYRKLKKDDGSTPTGRGNRNSSAWDSSDSY